MDFLADMTWGQWMLAVMVTLICLFLILVILLQRGRGMGLAGAFGGGGSSAFGAKTGDVFTWITVGVASVFLLLIIAGNFLFDMSAEAKPNVADTTPAAIPASPQPGPMTPAPGSGEPGSSAKPFPIRLEQVPVDPNDPSKGTTFQAVPVKPGEEGAPPAEGDAQPQPAPEQKPSQHPAAEQKPAAPENKEPENPPSGK